MPLITSEKNPKTPKIRVGVVGVGVMGQHHLRIYSHLKNVELVAVVDIDIDRARETKWRYGCEAYSHVEDLIGKVDAVSIAVPSSLHAEIGLFLLQHGIHCLIEKPLATTESDCLKLIEAAESKGVVLAVGHIEQFNPAVQELKRILSEQDIKIHGIDVERMNATLNRILDVDVILDLMVHDLDIVLSFINYPVVSLTAEASSLVHPFRKTSANSINTISSINSIHTGNNANNANNANNVNTADYVSALLAFSNGSIASLKASKITQKKIRQMSLTTDMGFIHLNYTAQEILIHKQGPTESNDFTVQKYKCDEIIERVQIRNREPLLLELEHFIAAVTTETPFMVTPQQALRALKVVWQLQDKISHQEKLNPKAALLEPI